MFGKISPTDYERCYPTRMKRYFRRNINYLPKTYDEIIPNVKNQIVGNLPPEIINLICSNKKDKIKAFQQAIAQLAEHIRSTRNQMKSNEVKSFEDYYSPEKIKIYEQNISQLLNEKLAPIFEGNYQAELKFANNGGFAELFRFSLKNREGKKVMHDKALKVFYYIIEPLTFNKSMHNNFAEANFWTYIKQVAGHKLDKTQFTRHYISDMKSGYYMTEFIDDNIHPTTKKLHLKRLGIKFIDWDHNKPIETKDFYDGGGFIKRPNFIDDKVVLRYFKKIINRNTEKEQLKILTNFEKLVENPKTPHRDKIQKAIELYKQYSEQEAINTAKKRRNPFILINKLFKFFTDKQEKLVNLFEHQ